MKRVLLAIMLIFMASITAISQNIITLQPGPDEGKDAQLWTIYPNTNFGANRKFVAMGWTFYVTPGVHRAIIEFDLSEIPEDALVDDAKLYLYFYSDEPSYVPHTGQNQAYLKPITTHWEEDLVTWNTQPYTATDHMAYVPASVDPEQDYEIDVTELIQAMHENTVTYYGMMLQLEYEIPYNCLMFASSDNDDPALRPKLVIEYCYPPECGFDYTLEDDIYSFYGNSPTAYSWWWDFDDGFYSDLQNPMHQFWEYGTYFVCLTVEDSCGSATYCGTIVYQPEVPQVIIFNPGPEEGKDAQLWSVSPDTNLGQSPLFAAMGWTFYGGNPGMHRAIVDFDFSLIPEDVNITQANLYLNYYSHPPNHLPHTGENQGFLKLITTPWDEDLVTWNTQPMTIEENMVYIPASIGPEQDYEIEVTGLIQVIYDNPVTYHGMMLQLENEVPYNCLMFGSSDNMDSTLWPKLVVEYCYLPLCKFDYEVNGLDVSFIDKSAPVDNWYWDFGDGYFSNLQHPSHEYDFPGDYIVSLTVTDDCGSSVSMDTLHLDMVGLTTEPSVEMKVYPNPANNMVSVKFPKEGHFNIILLSPLGRIMKQTEEQVMEGEVVPFDISSLASGLYFLKVEGQDSSFFQKLIIQH